ncbi:carboxypeptidase regulatory-like domain-containing protein [Vicingaceae bacterium]|nr:carboxypeptidase regulatory-like domain-containing protein [Vicingaceae bacterium]
MLKKLAVLVSVFFTVSLAIAQSGGTIKGKILDKDNNEPLPFASVVLKKGGGQVAGATTDFDGKFTFPALTPGKYDIEATYVGYQPIKVAGIIVNGGKITFVKDIKASSGAENLEEFVVVEYEVPLISKDQTSSGGTVTAEDIKKMPGRSAAAIAATVGGVYSQDDGSNDLSVRGARSASTDLYIDGIKVRGSQNLPKSAIEQVSVITGGVPAQYGDVTGGVVNITTKGASKEWFGGIEYVTSGFKTGDNKVVGFDNFGFNLLGFSVSGPILTKKDSAGNKKDAIAGFFLSGEFKHEVDPRPYLGGDTKVIDSKMDELNESPFTLNSSDIGGVVNSADYLRSSDLEQTPFRLNVGRKSMNLAGKIDLVTSKTTSVAIGGSFDRRDARGYSRSGSLLNSQNNGQFINNTWRVYGRFIQRFANSTDEENPSLIKDAFVSFQVDYSKINNSSQSDVHGENISHYGYVGKFTTTRVIDYSVDQFTPTVNGVAQQDQFGDLSNEVTTAYSFEPGDLNPILANYTTNYYNAFANDPIGNIDNILNVQSGQGLTNGARPNNVYQLWNSMGTPYNGYSKFDGSQFRVSAQGSASIKDHAIQIGFEYEQNIDRNYTVNGPAGLWSYGRNLVNTQRDSRNVEFGQYDSVLVNTSPSLYRYTFDQRYVAGDHSTFDKNLRESLGMAEQGLNWIDFDSYGADVWNIGMFSPDELINGGGYVNTYGYDYEGNQLSGNPSLDDFFNKTDERGDYLREAGAFTPIYVAGYIQDKFSFDDLVFNIGVRIDRYDANQSVLKDKYSLLPIKTVGDVQDQITQANGVEIPSNIGDDFQIYIADAADPKASTIVGFRDGDTWYNSEGEEIQNPSVLHATGIPQPWLEDVSKNNVFRDLNSESFKDYEPQVNISPRIAFSFPISDEALFFAHYDVLTQRPSGGVNRLDLISYLGFNQGGTNLFNNPFNNPDLKAEQTIDYELGFQQKLDNYSSLKFAGFYRENRDQVQITQVLGAYPGNYQTYGNKDFGTVKGMTIAYDLRTRGNMSLRANYTLQFADGTGSDITTSTALVQGGFGNLRTLIPLNFDQRHSIQLSGDYRYGSKKNYNGPVMFGKDILQNTGFNLIMRSGSGRPYTKRGRVNGSQVFINGEGRGNQAIDGQLNSSRLPFATTFDFKIDRTIDVKFGKVKEGEDRKEASINIYFQILNLLDAKNILSVYSYTGNAEDDGFLAASYQQTFIENQTSGDSFRDLYSAKVTDGSNFALPRRIRLGIELNF